jgi:putative transposase
MIDREHKLPSAAGGVLGISRGSRLLPAAPVSDADLKRSCGSTSCIWSTRSRAAGCCATLVQEGFKVGRLHVATLMKRMGIEAIYRRPNTSKPAPGHKIYPYLLRKLPITRPNQVWAMDITYIPMARGFVYLAAVVDWFSRRVLAWRVSITLEATSASKRRGGAGEIRQAGDLQHGPGQPVHLHPSPGAAAATRSHQHGRQGRVAGQRLRRAPLAHVKYEEVYLRAYASVSRRAPRSADI